jgi:hypothetical protein
MINFVHVIERVELSDQRSYFFLIAVSFPSLFLVDVLSLLVLRALPCNEIIIVTARICAKSRFVMFPLCDTSDDMN